MMLKFMDDNDGDEDEEDVNFFSLLNNRIEPMLPAGAEQVKSGGEVGYENNGPAEHMKKELEGHRKQLVSSSIGGNGEFSRAPIPPPRRSLLMKESQQYQKQQPSLSLSLEEEDTRRRQLSGVEPENWRLSKCSVSSSIYHSAQDLWSLMLNSSNEGEYFEDSSRCPSSRDTFPLTTGVGLSPQRSFHSFNENGSVSIVNERDEDQDIFSSPQNSPTQGRKSGKTVAFQEVMPLKDVDFVLVWDGTTDKGSSELSKERRRIFERNLEEEGLILEREKLETSNLNFVKIHAPIEILRRYTEILKLRMPMRELQGDIVHLICAGSPEFDSLVQIPQMSETKIGKFADEVRSWFQCITQCCRLDSRVFPEKDTKLTAVFSRDKDYLFDVNEAEFFTTSVRGRIVDFILSRKRYTEDNYDDFAFGIDRMIRDENYTAAYPLHDGDIKQPGTTRHLLSREWASISKCLKYQPIDDVKEYFGVKIGLYFAWLGYYTHMLIPAAIFGFLCFLYGCFTLYHNEHSEDICKDKLKEPMCPLCDKLCDYWKLKDTCFYARLTYLFDNDATVFFAIIMSFWTAIFLEYWKRYAAEISHRWDLTGWDINEEHPRPEYLARLKNVKRKCVNIVTNTPEPYVPFWKMKLPYTMFSLSVILLLITLAIAAVVAVVIYRVSIFLVLSGLARGSPQIISWSLIVVSSTAACINLIFIYFFNWLYSFLAEYLTELEFNRTQTEFDDSVTLKMYLLQFVNYYSSIFYIAFFKGRFIGSPNKYTKLFGRWRQEECGPGGCMTELCIQLAIIMVGKQLLNMILEMGWPMAIKWINNFKIMTGMTVEKHVVFNTQWAKDLKLLPWGSRSLFPEYLEMVLQYGFVTIFVAAFPLAPVFALLNNVLEMRLDAKKLLTYYRRPVGQRVKDIGIWYGILDSIGKLAVISNAFIIALTSNFIPKLVYRFQFGSLDGFLEHSLALFNTSEPNFEANTRPIKLLGNETIEFDPSVTVCRYQAYRSNYTLPENQRYKRTEFYWKVWMARLAFVVVFENVVALGVIILRWVIPDVPRKLAEKIRRENYLTNEIIIKQEMLRARGISAGGDSTAWNPIAGAKELELVRSASHSQSNSLRKRHKNDMNDTESAEVMV